MKRRIDKQIEDGLTRLGADLMPPNGWEDKVKRKLAETTKVKKSNDKIPADEMNAAESLAVLYDGPAKLLWDAWDRTGGLHLMVDDEDAEEHIDTVALVNGETPDEDREATEAHLAECEPCSTALLDDMQLAVMLESSAPPIVEDRAVDKSPLVDQGGEIDDRFDHGGES